ncbi:MAG: non-heme iron oxygenase ferredoxin subunit [Candidatus Melainabacteria bacterium]|nr:non-heme iron oxygenase ferredoxin subunit [Candidatus Melainabacteria bacterium]
MPEFHKVLQASELEVGNSKLVQVDGRKIALFNVAGSYYAIDDTCTHRGGTLSDGSLDGTQVTCPLHGAIFDVTTGQVKGPPAPAPVAKYNVRIVDAHIEIEV